MKRFLWGVEGVREGGTGEAEPLFGGVCDRVPSLVLMCDDGGKTFSGDRAGVVVCGTDPSKSSARSKVEKVRFASSAG